MTLGILAHFLQPARMSTLKKPDDVTWVVMVGVLPASEFDTIGAAMLLILTAKPCGYLSHRKRRIALTPTE
jgi:hypothetical protein